MSNIERWNHLTPREKQIALKFVVEDMKAYAVADELGIAKRTVTWHLEGIYRILNVSSKAQLAFEMGRNWEAIISKEPPAK